MKISIDNNGASGCEPPVDAGCDDQYSDTADTGVTITVNSMTLNNNVCNLHLCFFQLMDTNEDGVITEDEFIEGCQKVSQKY